MSGAAQPWFPGEDGSEVICFADEFMRDDFYEIGLATPADDDDKTEANEWLSANADVTATWKC